MPPTRTYHQRSFAPFPIMYSSESFTPLIRKDRQIAHIQYLLRGQHAALARFRHYLTDCSTIFMLEQTIQELRDNRDHIFADFTTPDVIYQLQPFLIQSQRQSLAPIAIATTTTTSTDSTYSQSSTRRLQEYTPIIRLPRTHHDNVPIVVATPTVIHTPTLTPIANNSLVRYVSPLTARFNPCSSCGSANNHFPGCTN